MKSVCPDKSWNFAQTTLVWLVGIFGLSCAVFLTFLRPRSPLKHLEILHRKPSFWLLLKEFDLVMMGKNPPVLEMLLPPLVACL